MVQPYVLGLLLQVCQILPLRRGHAPKFCSPILLLLCTATKSQQLKLPSLHWCFCCCCCIQYSSITDTLANLLGEHVVHPCMYEWLDVFMRVATILRKLAQEADTVVGCSELTSVCVTWYSCSATLITSSSLNEEQLIF